uniref:Uncharacterized protein n=1 Tax=Photinus pyralis TaxID=7054 RepID=A0A1Y1KTY3_PHOPY
MRAVAILELDGTGTNGKGQELVAKTDAHDGDGRSLHQTGQVVDSLLAVSWVAGTVGDEDAIVVLGNLVDRVIIREDGNRGTTADQASENVLLDTAINKSNVERGTGRLDHKGSLGAHTFDKVDLARVDEALVFVGVVFFANGNPSKGGSLFSEESDNLTSIDARNGWDTLTGAPLAQTLDSSPMAVVESYIRNDNASTLNVGGLKMLEKVVLVSLVGGHSVVANERLGENQNLTTVRRVSHGLGVADQRGGEDSFARDVGIGTKSRAIEDRAISNGEGSRHRVNGSSALGGLGRHLPASASSGSLGYESELNGHSRGHGCRRLKRRLGEVNCQSREHGNSEYR